MIKIITWACKILLMIKIITCACKILLMIKKITCACKILLMIKIMTCTLQKMKKETYCLVCRNILKIITLKYLEIDKIG